MAKTAKTTQVVINIAVTVVLQPGAHNYTSEQINNMLTIKSNDRDIRVTSHIAEEQPA